tara:strand:+ start:102 stop:587 length:486 start_codon:yes stop_codon:yes gene_type:complete
MKKEEILREQLTRMRQLMGMNGSLYQKPIVGEDVQDVKGHIALAPNPDNFKGGAKNADYQAQLAKFNSQHPPAPRPRPRPPASPPASPPPSPPASPPPSPPPAAKKTGKGYTSSFDMSPKKGSSSKGTMKGDYVLPMGAIPKFGNSKTGKKGKKNKKKDDN